MTAYLVEVTFLDGTKQKGIASLIDTFCTDNCWGLKDNEPHQEWAIPKDSSFKEDGLVKSVDILRELKSETESTATTPLDYLLHNDSKVSV